MNFKHRSLVGEEQEDQAENKEWSNALCACNRVLQVTSGWSLGKTSQGNLAAMPKGLRKGEVLVSLYFLCQILGQAY